MMSIKTTVVTSSTNIESGTTTARATALPSSVMGLPREERDFTASRIILENNPPLENIKDKLPNAVHPILAGDQEATFIKDGPVVNIFNLSGPNARVYISSDDCSTNVANITPEEVFKELRRIISDNIQQEAERSDLLSKVKELEQSRATTRFVNKYSEFIALAADHLALFTPILPALTQWITGII